MEQVPRAKFSRLLHDLGLERHQPDLGFLNRLVRAFMLRVPFENVSKLYYLRKYDRRTVPDSGVYLEGIERYHFGGTCHSNNHYLNLLLRDLGYDARLCGADMKNPDVHLVNMVTVEEREFLVDAGYAAPFMAPLPRDLGKDYEVELGRDRYVLKPQDDQGCSRLIMYREGAERHGYIAKPIPREYSYFTRTIEDSFRPDATFLNSLLLVRMYAPDRSLVISNLSVIRSEGRSWDIEELAGPEDLPGAIEEHFSIPSDIVTEAIVDMSKWGDSWS